VTPGSAVVELFAAAAAVLAFGFTVVVLKRVVPRYRARFDAAVSRQLARSHLYVDATRLLALNVGAVVLATVVAVWLTASVPAAVAAALACGLVPRLVLAWIRMRRLSAFRNQLSDLMLLTAGGMRAGLGLPHALEQTAREIEPPARQELGLMMREQRLGASFDEALAGLERRMPLEETALLAAALRISRETGGNLAETLEALGDAIRRKTAIEGKIRALTSQAKLQGWAMGLLPLGVGSVLWLIEPVAMSAMFTTRWGLAVCACIAVMQLLGLHFLRRIVRIDV
jgi:tight adherence protein B